MDFRTVTVDSRHIVEAASLSKSLSLSIPSVFVLPNNHGRSVEQHVPNHKMHVG